MEHYLYINGCSTVAIDEDNNKYYVLNTFIDKSYYGWECLFEVDLETFRKVLRTSLKWIPDSWNKELVKGYNKLLEV